MGSFVPGDVKSGEKIFKTRCAYCHTVEKGAAHKKGPNLSGLFGRQPGAAPGFSYYAAKDDTAAIWDEKTLHDYLLNHKFIHGGLKNPQEYVDLIAYLKESA